MDVVTQFGTINFSISRSIWCILRAWKKDRHIFIYQTTLNSI
jgi:hypothetical protein